MKRTLLGLIQLHLGRHPGFGLEDLAKLVYQGVFGADHLLVERERFVHEFLREWECVDEKAFPEEPLFESVDPLDRTHRLNLRPAKRKGADPEALAEVLLSQPRKRGAPAEFQRRWELVVELAEEGTIPFSPGALRAYGALLLETGLVPHHSRPYRRHNRPHYRLVNDFWDEATRSALRSLGLL